MRNPIITALAIVFTGFFAATPAFAECTRLAFTVNDYGKEGPTRDALNLLDKHIATEMEKRGITDYRVGEKDVSCELFLDLIVFDEHTCKAAANVCWGKDKRKALITAKKKSKTSKKKVAKKTKPKQKSETKTAAKPSKEKSKTSSSVPAAVAKIDDAPRVGESAVRAASDRTASGTPVNAKKSTPQVVRTIEVTEEKAGKGKPARGAVMSLATRASEDLDARPESPIADAATAAPDAATAGILAARKRAELARQAAAKAAARAAQEAANAERAAKERARAEAEQERAARAVAIAAREAARAAKAAAKAASEAAARAAEAAHAAASAENSSIATGSLKKK